MAFVYINKNIIAKKLRINNQITSPTVRVIDEDGAQLGIMAIEKAIATATEKNLDLAEMSPNSTPPVCKIIDYGKYRYHQKKVDTKHRKSQKKTEVKGVRMGFKTGEHDIGVKVRQATKFLKAGNSVKISLIFRGREIVYKDLAIQKLMKFYEQVEEYSTIETSPKGQGNTLIMILTPKKS